MENVKGKRRAETTIVISPGMYNYGSFSIFRNKGVFSSSPVIIFFALISFRLMRYRQRRERKKLPSPTIIRFSHLHWTMFSVGFTRITIIGKVRNINQRETPSDLFISVSFSILSSDYHTKAYICHYLVSRDSPNVSNLSFPLSSGRESSMLALWIPVSTGMTSLMF